MNPTCMPLASTRHECAVHCMQVQEKLALRMLEEEERRMYDTLHEAEHQRMQTR